MGCVSLGWWKSGMIHTATRMFAPAICAGLIACSLAAIEVNAQDFERYKPKVPPPSAVPPSMAEPPAETTPASDEVLVGCLDAVVILDKADKVKVTDPLGDSVGLSFDFEDKRSLVFSNALRRIVDEYLGQPITLRRLNELSRKLILFYRKHDLPVVDVQIPEQNISAGTVQLVVIESRVGEIQFSGVCRTDLNWLRDQVRCTREGNLIYEPRLKEDLYWLNRSPFRRVELDMKPGRSNGTTDVWFKTREVRPFRSYVGYEDTGVRSLALERLTNGFMIGNIFGRDGTLGYQYTADPKFNLLEAHSVSFNYDFNRDWGILSYGSWSSARPDLPPPLNQDGEAWQAGTFVNRYLKRSSNHDERLTFGFDFKSTNNNLEFGGVNVQTSQADLFQLNLGYEYFHRYDDNGYDRRSHDLYVGPGDGFSSDNTSQAFNSIRVNTDPTYWYYRGALERLWALDNCWELRARGSGQATNERLLFSETMGLGDHDSLRGYDQRIASGDCGWNTTLEFGPRPRNLGCEHQPKMLKYYAFSDMGQLFINQPVTGEEPELFLASAGLGFRYSVSSRLTLRFDYGHAFRDLPSMVTNDRLHIGLVSFFGPSP